MTCIVMSGMVGVMQAGGGVRAAVNALSRRIRNSHSAMLFTELAGIVIFLRTT